MLHIVRNTELLPTATNLFNSLDQQTLVQLQSPGPKGPISVEAILQSIPVRVDALPPNPIADGRGGSDDEFTGGPPQKGSIPSAAAAIDGEYSLEMLVLVGENPGQEYTIRYLTNLHQRRLL